MAPSVECVACKNYKARTEHEPASEDEMTRLIRNFSFHAGVGAAELTSLAPGEKAHMAWPKYHEKTPDKGFEKAEVV